MGTPPKALPLKPRLVLTSTFPIHPRVGGGQQRTYYLCRALTGRVDIEIVSLTDSTEKMRRLQLAPGLVETVVPKSSEHEVEEARQGAGMPYPVSDILSSGLIDRSPVYLETLKSALRGAAGVILEHPYLFPALAAVGARVPIFYDAQNVEVALKSESLSSADEGARLVAIVRQVEGDALEAASLVFFCTDDDRDLLASEFGVADERFIFAPNGVDTSAIKFVDGASRAKWRDRWLQKFGESGGRAGTRSIALFVASLHGPNIDAAERLMKLAAGMEDVLFLVAGSVCEYFRRLPVPGNVALLGTIPDSTKMTLLQVAGVGLNPMVQGSGSNLKMLDYLAAGVPVVSTSHGARGLDLGDGMPSVKITTMDDFGSAVRAALDDPVAASSGALNARMLVERLYDWNNIGRPVVDAVSRVLELERLPA